MSDKEYCECLDWDESCSVCGDRLEDLVEATEDAGGYDDELIFCDCQDDEECECDADEMDDLDQYIEERNKRAELERRYGLWKKKPKSE